MWTVQTAFLHLYDLHEGYISLCDSQTNSLYTGKLSLLSLVSLRNNFKQLSGDSWDRWDSMPFYSLSGADTPCSTAQSGYSRVCYRGVSMTGQQFRELRRQLGLSQDELASKMGRHRMHVVRLEKQASVPPMEELAMQRLMSLAA